MLLFANYKEDAYHRTKNRNIKLSIPWSIGVASIGDVDDDYATASQEGREYYVLHFVNELQVLVKFNS